MSFSEPPSPPDPRPARPAASFEGAIAWEARELDFPRRLLNTLRSGFHPIASAAACCAGPLGPALWFALLTLVPPLLAWGVIPFTHTLMFGPAFAVTLAKGAGFSAAATDVVRAVGLGFGLGTLQWLSWVVPFVSLTSAFAATGADPEEARRAAWRTALYRGWLVPTGMCLWTVCIWGAPKGAPAEVLLVLQTLTRMVPRLLLLAHCQSTARNLGASYWGSLGVALVPLGVEETLGALVWTYAASLFPEPPA